MKVALASEDGLTLSGHFGHCDRFVVLTVVDGKLAGREERLISEGASAQPGHGNGQGACHCHGGAGPGSRLGVLRDCQVVVSLGMGPRAAQMLADMGLRPVVLAGPAPLEDAALAVAQGLAEERVAGEGCGCHGSHGRQGHHGGRPSAT